MNKLIVDTRTARLLQENDQAVHHTVMKDRGSAKLNREYAVEKYLLKDFWVAEPTVNIFNDETQKHIISYPNALPRPEGFRSYTAPSKGSNSWYEDHRFQVKVIDVIVDPVRRFEKVAQVTLTLSIISKKDIDYLKDKQYP